MAKIAEKFHKVSKIISRFVGMGCSLQISSICVEIDGHPDFYPRFLMSPDGKKFAPIDDLKDDENIPESEIAYWERRLGINIPRDSDIH